MFFLYLVLALGSTISFDEKEEACFLLSTASVVKRRADIQDYIKTKTGLREAVLRMKISEDTFNYCMDTITDEIGSKILQDRSYVHENSHIVNVDLNKYRTDDDLKLDTGFVDTRKKISARISAKRKGQDL